MKPNVSPKQASKNSGIPSLLRSIQTRLKPFSDSSYLDALQVLSHLTGLDRSHLAAHPNPDLDADTSRDLENALVKLEGGTPLPYVLGVWEFYQLSFQITPDVLIPRPETEGLVDRAVEWLQEYPSRRSCLELGTGCGCIAITLARAYPDLMVTATDISSAALKIARQNARLHQVQNQITFLERDLLGGVPGTADLLVANLPYIPSGKLKKLAVYHTEPTLALDGGKDGLRLIKKVLQGVRDHINPGGAIFLEIDEDTGAAALDLAHDIWPGITLTLEQDLAGQDRYLSIRCP